MKTVSIIGLGYVGLPLACLCVEKGLEVYGIDIDLKKIDMIKNGQSPIDDPELNKKIIKIKEKIKLTSDFEEAIPNSSIAIVCVPTPVDSANRPNLEPLKNACKSLSLSLKKDTLVIIESTIFPGTTEEIVLPILKESELDESDFFLAHCPERIDPGNKKYNIWNIPRVIGGLDKESSKKASDFYKKILKADITILSSVKAAEATKIMENTFRDVNIAFVNEMAKSFDKAGIDITEVIKGASSKPFAFMPHYPGSGVGGHCICQDPYYLISKAKQLGFNHEFLSLARKINESMPDYTVELLEKELKKIDKKIKHSKIGILGISYKANVDDTRESPFFKIVRNLKQKKAELFVFDPYLEEKSNVKDIDDLLDKADYIILVTDHDEFKNLDIGKLKQNNIKVIIDGRNCLDKEKIKELGIIYHGIGRS